MEESIGIYKSSSDLMNKTAETISSWLCLANVIFKLEILWWCRRLRWLFSAYGEKDMCSVSIARNMWSTIVVW